MLDVDVSLSQEQGLESDSTYFPTGSKIVLFFFFFFLSAAGAVLIQVISDVFPFCHPCGHCSSGQIHQLILCGCHRSVPFSVTWRCGRAVNTSQSPTFPGTFGGIQKV